MRMLPIGRTQWATQGLVGIAVIGLAGAIVMLILRPGEPQPVTLDDQSRCKLWALDHVRRSVEAAGALSRNGEHQAAAGAIRDIIGFQRILGDIPRSWKETRYGEDVLYVWLETERALAEAKVTDDIRRNRGEAPVTEGE